MEHYGDSWSAAVGLFLLYMIAAFCCACFLIVFGLIAFVLACIGQYSWKAMALLGAWCACWTASVWLLFPEGALFFVAVSPAIGLGMWWLENTRMKNKNTALSD
jgi:hypothetical protein